MSALSADGEIALSRSGRLTRPSRRSSTCSAAAADSDPQRAADNKARDDTEAEQLEQRYDQFALPDYPTPPVGGAAVRWFAGPDVVLRDDQ